MDGLTRITLDLAADLLQPMPPYRAQAATLSRLDAAGFRAAFLRTGDGVLHWACDEAHLSPGVLSHLQQTNRALVGGSLFLPIDQALPFAGALVSLTAQHYDGASPGGATTWHADREAAGSPILHSLAIEKPLVCAPVVHQGHALGLLLIWSDAVTPELAAPAEHLGRILGAAIARANEETTPPCPPQPCPDALHALQSVIATLSMEQPLEQSLAQIRDILPKLVPGWLPPLFTVRDFDSGEWIWRPLLPEGVAQILEERTGVSLASIAAPIGASEVWRVLSQGQAIFTQDSAELVGHLLEPETARAMQRALGIGSSSAIPLYWNGEVQGLMFACSQRNEWSDDEKALLQACAGHIALALHNARLYQRQQQVLSRIRTVLERAENLLLPVPPAQRLQAIVDEAVELLNADAGALYVLQPDGHMAALAYRGVSAQYVRMVCENYANLRISRVMALGMLAHIPDMTDDPNITGPVLQAVLEEGLRSMIAVPLTARGMFHAVLVLYRRRPVPFSQATTLGAQAYATLARLSYETLTQWQRAERQMAQTGALIEIVREILLPRESDRSLYDIVLEHACRLTDAQHGKLYLWDDKQHALVEKASMVNGQPLAQGFVLKPGEGLAGTVFLQGEPITLDDYMTWNRRLETVSGDAIGPATGVPVRLGDEVIGAIVLGRNFPGPVFDDEDVDVAAALADEVAIYLARVRAEEQRDRERRFARQVLDAMLSIVVVLDPDTTCATHVNQYLLDKTGWSREDVLGKPWVETFVPAAWRDRVHEVARRLRNQKGGFRFANPIVTKDGRELFVEWYNAILCDEKGRPAHIVAVGVIAGG